MDPKTITLNDLGDGAAEELFQAALSQVLANIDDPNTEAKARRSISLTFSFGVEEDRRAGKIGISCSTKLAGVRPASATVFLGRHKGKLAAVAGPSQSEMFPSPIGVPVAVPGDEDEFVPRYEAGAEGGE